jgi:hypothetical protein
MKGKLLTQTDVIERLEVEVEEAGSQAELARELKIFPTELCAVLRGRRAPPRIVLERLGLVKVAAYAEK